MLFSKTESMVNQKGKLPTTENILNKLHATHSIYYSHTALLKKLKTLDGEGRENEPYITLTLLIHFVINTFHANIKQYVFITTNISP
uniref:Uncharacterized protein n=1 Tax=Anguilla anguilla TaxID=7936 RepID=A0A0E9X1X5_ANGAN